MQERGYRVTAVRDATCGLGLEDEEVTLGRWASQGSVVTLSDLIRGDLSEETADGVA